MFENVKIPQKIDSPIQEAVFEIRYEGKYPEGALYGLLFDIFKKFPHSEDHALPILQMPSQIRSLEPNLRYQPYYRAIANGFAFAIGPHSIIFSALKPYLGWKPLTDFFMPKLDEIKHKGIISFVERIGFRTFDVFPGNILY